MAHGLLKFFRSVLLGLAVSTAAVQAGESIVVASTTSTEQSGLFNFILPIFEKDSGIAVRVVATEGTLSALVPVQRCSVCNHGRACIRGVVI